MTGRVLVTGAAGFIGSYVVRRLLDRGTPVRVLVRRPEAIPPAVARHVEVVQADIRDGAAVRRALDAVEAVAHLAACAKVWPRDPREFAAVNVEAVATLLSAARQAGVRSLVHVSTILTRPPARRALIARGAASLTPYELTKLAGERLVESYAQHGGHAVIVHPTRVYGPGPLHDANGVTKAITLYLAGRLRLRLADDDVLASYVHADDVAQGIVHALARGKNGAHYVLGGTNASFRDLLSRVDALTGAHRHTVAIAPTLALAIARGAEWWGRLGGRAFITRGWIRSFLEDRRTDSAEARRDLGYAPRPLDVGLAETLSWLRNGRHQRTRAP